MSRNRAGHPAAISDRHIAQDSQNRACPHSTGDQCDQHAAPRGTLRSCRQRLMQLPALAVANSDAAEVVAADRDT